MRTIVQPVEINKDDIGLWIELEVDGETKYSAKGNSLLTNWLALLYSFMSGETIPINMAGFGLGSGTDVGAVTMVPVTFSRIEFSPGVYRTMMIGDTLAWSSGDYVQVMGVGNGSAGTGVNGFWSIQETATDSGMWWLYDVDAADYVDVIDVASINYSVCTPYARELNLPAQNGFRSQEETFSNPQICIGYDTTANKVFQSVLNAEIPNVAGGGVGTVVDGAASISTPTVGSGMSIIEVTQSFTNNSASVGFSVNEVGLWGRVDTPNSSTNKRFALLARDVLGAPVAVGASQVLTVKYRIIVKVDTVSNDGGILASFNEILYRHMAQTTREAKDIDNANQNQADDDGSFCVAGPGGYNNQSASAGASFGNELGPQIGHSQKIVENTDFRLQYAGGDTNYAGGTAIEGDDSRYQHGTGQYQVRHFGPIVHGWETGEAPNYAQFQVDKIFENLSGGTLTVNEIGFFIGRRTTTALQEIYAMCRNRITPFSLLDGEVAKVTYIFRINL